MTIHQHPQYKKVQCSFPYRYLIGHQLKGDASIEAYISALKRGVRVLEREIYRPNHLQAKFKKYTLPF